MIYLYAGLGIAMISGISAMMQIGNNLNNMAPLNALKENNYVGNLPSYDRQIMKILYTQSVPDTDICSYVKNSIEEPEYDDGDIFCIAYIDDFVDVPLEDNLKQTNLFDYTDEDIKNKRR